MLRAHDGHDLQRALLPTAGASDAVDLAGARVVDQGRDDEAAAGPATGEEHVGALFG